MEDLAKSILSDPSSSTTEDDNMFPLSMLPDSITSIRDLARQFLRKSDALGASETQGYQLLIIYFFRWYLLQDPLDTPIAAPLCTLIIETASLESLSVPCEHVHVSLGSICKHFGVEEEGSADAEQLQQQDSIQNGQALPARLLASILQVELKRRHAFASIGSDLVTQLCSLGCPQVLKRQLIRCFSVGVATACLDEARLQYMLQSGVFEALLKLLKDSDLVVRLEVARIMVHALEGVAAFSSILAKAFDRYNGFFDLCLACDEGLLSRVIMLGDIPPFEAISRSPFGLSVISNAAIDRLGPGDQATLVLYDLSALDLVRRIQDHFSRVTTAEMLKAIGPPLLVAHLTSIMTSDYFDFDVTPAAELEKALIALISGTDEGIDIDMACSLLNIYLSNVPSAVTRAIDSLLPYLSRPAVLKGMSKLTATVPTAVSRLIPRLLEMFHSMCSPNFCVVLSKLLACGGPESKILFQKHSGITLILAFLRKHDDLEIVVHLLDLLATALGNCPENMRYFNQEIHCETLFDLLQTNGALAADFHRISTCLIRVSVGGSWPPTCEKHPNSTDMKNLDCGSCIDNMRLQNSEILAILMVRFGSLHPSLSPLAVRLFLEQLKQVIEHSRNYFDICKYDVMITLMRGAWWYLAFQIGDESALYIFTKLASHHLGPTQVRKLFSMLQDSKFQKNDSFLDAFSTIADRQEHSPESFARFDSPRTAYVDFSCRDHSEWPPKHGLSISLFMQFETPIKRESGATVHVLACQPTSANCHSYVALTLSEGHLTFWVSTFQSITFDQYTFSENQWYHIVVCHGHFGQNHRNICKLFVDGVQVGESSLRYESPSRTKLVMRMGDQAPSCIQWKLGNTLIFRCVLKLEQVRQLCDEGPGSTGTDFKLGLRASLWFAFVASSMNAMISRSVATNFSPAKASNTESSTSTQEQVLKFNRSHGVYTVEHASIRDQLSCVGGISSLLYLVGCCESASFATFLLRLMGCLQCQRNDDHLDLSLLGTLLRVSPWSFASCDLVTALWDLIGPNFNKSYFRSLMDWRIWQKAPEDVQLALFSPFLKLCDEGKAHGCLKDVLQLFLPQNEFSPCPSLTKQLASKLELTMKSSVSGSDSRAMQNFLLLTHKLTPERHLCDLHQSHSTPSRRMSTGLLSVKQHTNDVSQIRTSVFQLLTKSTLPCVIPIDVLLAFCGVSDHQEREASLLLLCKVLRQSSPPQKISEKQAWFLGERLRNTFVKPNDLEALEKIPSMHFLLTLALSLTSCNGDSVRLRGVKRLHDLFLSDQKAREYFFRLNMVPLLCQIYSCERAHAQNSAVEGAVISFLVSISVHTLPNVDAFLLALIHLSFSSSMSLKDSHEAQNQLILAMLQFVSELPDGEARASPVLSECMKFWAGSGAECAWKASDEMLVRKVLSLSSVCSDLQDGARLLCSLFERQPIMGLGLLAALNDLESLVLKPVLYYGLLVASEHLDHDEAWEFCRSVMPIVVDDGADTVAELLVHKDAAFLQLVLTPSLKFRAAQLKQTFRGWATSYRENLEQMELAEVDFESVSQSHLNSVWELQTALQKPHFRRLQLLMRTDALAVRAWKQLAKSVTHARSCWPLPVKQWKLDPTEGPSRMRIRLKPSSVIPTPLAGLNIEDVSSRALIEKEDVVHEVRQCSLIHPYETRIGEIVLCTKHAYFLDSPESAVQENLHAQRRRRQRAFKLKARRGKLERWEWVRIRDLHKRRYLLRDGALEIFLTTGRTYLVVFDSTEVRDAVYNYITSQELPHRIRYEEEVALKGNLLKMSITQRWQRGLVSSFEYLQHLNTLAGRSYNDLTQYPVFPWVIADYTSGTLDLDAGASLRDLTKAMGAQTEKRLRSFMEKYDALVDMGEKPYHYGSHYSNVGTVLHFLVRLEPFSSYFLQFQGGRFDLPDRMFDSLARTYLQSSEKASSDVKEATPEFYYQDLFLRNLNKFDFGVKQNGSVVDDVKLPPWAKGSARLFTKRMREALESDQVSAQLPRWIDLIFGSLQHGEAARAACNLFHPLTYEGAVDIESIEDPVELNATLAQINSYGQVPRQLFVKDHPPRLVRPVVPALLKSPDSFLPSFASNVSAEIGYVEIMGTTPIVLGVNQVPLFPEVDTIMTWNHWHNSLMVVDLREGSTCSIVKTMSQARVLCSHMHVHGSILALGRSDGVVEMRDAQLTLLRAQHGHDEAVTCVQVSQEWSLIVSVSRDGTCICWDLNKFNFVRSFGTAGSAAISYVAISPTNGDIATVSESGELVLWSINGEILAEHQVADGRDVTCLQFSRSSPSVLLGGTRCGHVLVWSAWDLNVRCILDSGLRASIADMAVSPDCAYFLTGSETGEVLRWFSARKSSIETSF